uniref:Uncharacterized protein n=1 Tax=Anguilla anguilla TaxID=7936 RepID=A0A0E9XCQ5_ANGAN
MFLGQNNLFCRSTLSAISDHFKNKRW